MLIDFTPGQTFDLPLFIVSATQKVSKNGSNYITGEVRDKSLKLRYNMWDVDNISSTLPVAGRYAKITGKLDLFNNSKQIIITSVKFLDASEVDAEDFRKSTIRDKDSMHAELNNLVDSFTDDFVKYISSKILDDAVLDKYFKTAPAAKNVHNAWVGGLLEHSIAVAKHVDMLVSFYNDIYFAGKLDRDIAVCGALFHDIGKIWEYNSDTPDIQVTIHGELLGHIYMGTRKIADIAQSYIKEHKDEHVQDKVNKILHILLSHHGRMKYGSPVVPKTPEALLVHYMDNLDTKMMNAWENISECENEFTNPIFIQENARFLNILKD